MTTISDNSNNQYIKNVAITAVGVAAGWEGQTYIAKASRYPVGKYLGSNFAAVSGGGFKSYVETALNQNNLKDKLEIIDLNVSNASDVWKKLKFKTPKNPKLTKFIKHILRVPSNNVVFERTLSGQNAFFAPKANAVVCNFDKFGAPVFHEIQHKLNHLSSNIFIKSLVKLKHPLAMFGPLIVSSVALFTDKKQNGEKQGIADKIKNNCGSIAFICMLPHTIEEFIANIKGTSIAKNAGVGAEMLKKVKGAHRISMISYAAGALITAFSVWCGNKIRDKICEYKK